MVPKHQRTSVGTPGICGDGALGVSEGVVGVAEHELCKGAVGKNDLSKDAVLERGMVDRLCADMCVDIHLAGATHDRKALVKMDPKSTAAPIAMPSTRPI